MSDNLTITERKYDKLGGEIVDAISEYVSNSIYNTLDAIDGYRPSLEFTRTGVTVENTRDGTLREVFTISYSNKGFIFFTVDVRTGRIIGYTTDKNAFEGCFAFIDKKYRPEIINYLDSLIGLEIDFHTIKTNTRR